MDALSHLNFMVLLPIIIIELILVITALVDLAKREQTNGPKLLWVFVIILFNMLGPIIYFIFGRKKD